VFDRLTLARCLLVRLPATFFVFSLSAFSGQFASATMPMIADNYNN
jgi:hypothetical protein